MGNFLPSWIRIRIANPDPRTLSSPDPIRIRIHNTGRKFTNELWFLSISLLIDTEPEHCGERRTCAHVRSRNVQSGSEETFLGQLQGEPPRNPLQLHVRIRLQLPYNYQTHQSSNQRIFLFTYGVNQYFNPVLEFLNNLWGYKNQVGIEELYWPARLLSLSELVPWNRFLGSLKV